MFEPRPQPGEPPTAGEGLGEQYRRRLAEREAAATELARQDSTLSNVRLAAAAVTVGCIAAGAMRWLPIWSALLPLAGFLAAMLRHEQVLGLLRRHRAAVLYYRMGLARLEGDFGANPDGARFLDPHHPYAVDLDLFGPRSLFQLLCTTRTQGGEERLAQWLSQPATPAEVCRRQEAVRDLRERLELREELALLGGAVRSGVDPAAIAAWGEAPRQLGRRGPAGQALLGSGLVLAGAVGWGLTGQWWLLGLGALLGQAAVANLGGAVGCTLRGLDAMARELDLLAVFLERIEREEFQAPALRELSQQLAAGGIPPSERLARLRNLVGWLDAQRNGLFAFFAWLILWPVHLACRLDAWRGENGPLLRPWLEAVAELDALCALATYSAEHADDPFPVLEPAGGPREGRVTAEGLAHPLLRAAVRNDLALGGETRLILISGSNMSGKSTLLRAVGANVVLALAGAPVRAYTLSLTPLRVGASLRTQDSLQDGISRFYAEIQRLRQITDLAEGDEPLLFLLDELLHGTNSHDRRVGAEAVLRSLLRRGAIGLATTHDLALAAAARQMGPEAVNVHFQDEMVEGRMQFDYRLRPGVVERSNAIELMRAVGLEL